MATRVWETKSRWQKVSLPQTQVEQMVSQLDNTSACVSCWDHLCLHGGLGTWSLTVLPAPPWAFVSEQPLPHFCSCSILTIRWKGNKHNRTSRKIKQKINRKKWRSGVSLAKTKREHMKRITGVNFLPKFIWPWHHWQQSVLYLCLCPGT